MLYLRITQYGGFFCAQITNLTLLFLIYTRVEKLFGSYRHVMCIFAMYALLYSWIEIVTQPIVHVKVPLFIVIMDSPIKYQKWIGNDLTSVYCGSFALCISLLAIQFVYRYIAVCRPHNLAIFEGKSMILLFIPCITCFIVWTLLVHFGMPNTVEKQQYLKDELMLFYNEDSTKVSFIAPMYWSVDENGEKRWKLGDLFSSLGCCCIIALCFSTIIFCAVKTYFKMRDVRTSLSLRTRELNKQLFLTLGFQTVLPFFMMYIPVGLLITLPMFGIEAGRLTNIAGASVAIYPSLEPVIAIIFIKDFRNTILRRKKTTNVSSSKLQSHINGHNQNACQLNL